MSYTVAASFNFLIVIGALLGWLRCRRIPSSFYPFVLLLTLGFLQEAVSFLLILNHYSNALLYNVYTLLESFVILWQFQKWGTLKANGGIFWFLLLSFLGSWLLENFWLSSIHAFSSYFIIFYSFVIVLLSIRTLNVLIVEAGGLLFQNATFLICAAFLLYFTYSIMVETFWVYGLNRDAVFQSRVYDILVVINLLTNLFYTVSVLCIPNKPKFILLS